MIAQQLEQGNKDPTRPDSIALFHIDISLNKADVDAVIVEFQILFLSFFRTHLKNQTLTSFFVLTEQILVFFNGRNSRENAGHELSTHKLDEILDVNVVGFAEYSGVAFVLHLLVNL